MENEKSWIDRILERLNETSTWRGILAVALAAGINIAPEYRDAIISVCMALIGLINVVRKDKKLTVVTTAPVTITTPTTITTDMKG